MYLAKRRVIDKNGRKKFEFLIKCEKCGVEKWVMCAITHAKKKKYCSRKCINKGKKHTQEWKDNLSKQNSGMDNPFFGKKHSEEAKVKMHKAQQEIGGFYNMMKNKLSPEEFDLYWECYKEKFRGENNHFFGKTHSLEMRKHLSELRSAAIADGTIDIKPSHYGLKGYYTSTKANEKFRFDSFAEMIRMILLDRDDSVISWTKRHGIRIKYKLDGEIKNYVPDFMIIKVDGTSVIEEVKGYENAKKKELKFDALRGYCADNGYISSIVTYKQINDICPKEFGKSLWSLRDYYKKGNLSWLKKRK